jgi:hypothetical protein
LGIGSLHESLASLSLRIVDSYDAADGQLNGGNGVNWRTARTGEPASSRCRGSASFTATERSAGR